MSVTQPQEAIATPAPVEQKPKPSAPKQRAAAKPQAVAKLAKKAAAKKKSTATPSPVKKAPKKKASANPAPKVKVKLVRDSFTMPQSDYGLIDILKKRALKLGRDTKKSELLRAGLIALKGMSEAQFEVSLQSLTVIKTGRPKKGH